MSNAYESADFASVQFENEIETDRRLPLSRNVLRLGGAALAAVTALASFSRGPAELGAQSNAGHTSIDLIASGNGYDYNAQPELEVSNGVTNSMGNYVLTASSNETDSFSVNQSSNTTTMAGQVWMIKVNDLKTIGGMGSYEYVTCGLTTAPTTASNYTPCQPGQVPTYTSEATFASDVAHHLVPPGSTVLYDNEPWSYTPRVESDNAAQYEQLFEQVASANDIEVIGAPYGKSPGAIVTRDEAAARAGDAVVEIQAQFLDRAPKNYKGFVTKTAAKIHAIKPNTIVLAGLATDAGGTPDTAKEMYQEWKAVKDSGVQGFWLNANTWTTHAKGCAAQGCPATAQQFLQMIGVSLPK